jgi:adenosine deaminase
MSAVTMTEEFEKLRHAFDFGWDEFRWLTVNAMKSAFVHFDERLELINDVIKPGYAELEGPVTPRGDR